MAYLEIFLTAKPFTNRLMRMALINAHQKNVFLSLCKIFEMGFGFDYNKKEHELAYNNKKMQSLFFEGDKDWLEVQKKKIEEEVFKEVMTEKYRVTRDRIRRMMPFKQRVNDAELEKSASYDKFVAGLALFNITMSMEIVDEQTKI